VALSKVAREMPSEAACGHSDCRKAENAESALAGRIATASKRIAALNFIVMPGFMLNKSGHDGYLSLILPPK
jgi:hypothetical protein